MCARKKSVSCQYNYRRKTTGGKRPGFPWFMVVRRWFFDGTNSSLVAVIGSRSIETHLWAHTISWCARRPSGAFCTRPHVSPRAHQTIDPVPETIIPIRRGDQNTRCFVHKTRPQSRVRTRCKAVTTRRADPRKGLALGIPHGTGNKNRFLRTKTNGTRTKRFRAHTGSVYDRSRRAFGGTPERRVKINVHRPRDKFITHRSRKTF